MVQNIDKKDQNIILLKWWNKMYSYLRPRSSSIEKCWRCMGEPSLRHHVVSSDSRFYVILVNPNRDSHQHVLGPFNNLPLNLQEVRPLEGFEPKIIIVKVPVINYLAVQTRSILQPNKNNIKDHFSTYKR